MLAFSVDEEFILQPCGALFVSRVWKIMFSARMLHKRFLNKAVVAKPAFRA